MPSPDKFDTIIEAVNGGYGREATPTRLLKPVPARAQKRVRAHPVLSFEAGLALFLVNVILTLLLVWLLRHS